MSLLMRNGKFLTQYGKLLRASAKSYAEFLKCCCLVPCNCAAICETIHGRVIFQGVGCPEPAVCTTSEIVEFDLTEQDPDTIPGEQPGCLTLNRYWTGIPQLNCGIPSDPFFEMVCCTINGGPIMYLRIEGGEWCVIRDAGCDQYWAAQSSPGAEIFTVPGCCGVAMFQAWCDGWEPALPECDLVGTSTGPGACSS